MQIKIDHIIELYCGNCGKPFPAENIERVDGNDRQIIIKPCECTKSKE